MKIMEIQIVILILIIIIIQLVINQHQLKVNLS